MYYVNTGTYLREKVCTRYILGVKSMYQVQTGLCWFILVPYHSMVHMGTYLCIPVWTWYILLVRIPDGQPEPCLRDHIDTGTRQAAWGYKQKGVIQRLFPSNVATMLLRPMAQPHLGGAAWGQDNGNRSFFCSPCLLSSATFWYDCPASGTPILGICLVYAWYIPCICKSPTYTRHIHKICKDIPCIFDIPCISYILGYTMYIHQVYTWYIHGYTWYIIWCISMLYTWYIVVYPWIFLAVWNQILQQASAAGLIQCAHAWGGTALFSRNVSMFLTFLKACKSLPMLWD